MNPLTYYHLLSILMIPIIWILDPSGAQLSDFAAWVMLQFTS